MKTKMMYLFFLVIACSMNVKAQSVKVKIPNSLPKDVAIDKSVPKTYKMTTDYFDYDLKANFIKKTRIVGNVTRYSENDSIKWSEVYISKSKQLNEPFPAGEKQMELEGFKYVQSPKVVEEEFFAQMPNLDVRLKNLIWDILGFDVFVYPYWDSLKLNTTFDASEVNGEVSLSDDGVFENKEIQLSWIGLTKINGEVCAIIKYSEMNGKLSLDTEYMKMKGRSHYWGEIYVSLEDKQIEYATLKEDVLTDIIFQGQSNHLQGYTVRNISLETIK